MQSSSFDGSTALVTPEHVDGGGNVCDESVSVAGQQIPQAMLNDLSLMYLLQQQQQGSGSGNDGSPLMMMSPAALQSLLVSQMVAAMHPGMSPAAAASQCLVGASPSSSDNRSRCVVNPDSKLIF